MTAHADTLKERGDKACAAALGSDWEYSSGSGTQDDPFQCQKKGTNQIQTIWDMGLVFARWPSGADGSVLVDGATLHSDKHDEILVVEPADGGNVIVVWPAAPEEGEGGNIVLIWPEADLGDGGNIVLIWPAIDTGTADYSAEDDAVCGLDSKGNELWCIDLLRGVYTPGKAGGEAVTWEGTVERYDDSGGVLIDAE